MGNLTPDQKIAKARASIILGQAFFATILCSLEMVEETGPGNPTMKVNGERIAWNREFVDSMTFDETKFVLCHEVLHCVLEHPFRLKGRNRKLFNIAADYIINDILTEEKIGMMPDGGCYDKALVQAGKGTTDGVYNILNQMDDGDDEGDDQGNGPTGNGPTGSGSGNPHNPDQSALDNCEPDASPQGSAAEESAKAKMRVLAGQALQAARMCGQLGANMERILGSVLTPTVDWRAVLQDFMATKAKDEVSFIKPNRRFLAHDIYLPSRSGERLGKIAVAVDCSGSVNDKEIAEFAAEILDIKARLSPSEMHVVYFHHEVSRHDVFTQDEDAEIKPNGTGGTAFSPIFRKLEPFEGDLDCCVVLTDLCCNDFGPQPDYPVLWVSNALDNAPWGDVVMMKSGKV